MKRAAPKRSRPVERVARGIKLAVFDFDGVFTDNRVFVFQDGREAVVCSRADGIGLSRLKRAGCRTLVLSFESNPVVEARCKKLALDVIQSCEDKASALKAAAAEQHVDLAEVAFLGNDINDLPCMAIVGLPACVADAYPEVREAAAYATRAKGGRGAVREFCDFLVAAKASRAPSRRAAAASSLES